MNIKNRKNIKKHKLLIAFSLYIIFFIIIEYFSINYQLYGGLDAKFYYKTDCGYNFLISLSQSQRHHYIIVLIIDFFYLAAYTFLFYTLINFLFIKITKLKNNLLNFNIHFQILPCFPGSFDIIENIIIIRLLTKSFHLSLKLINILRFITLLKWVFIIINLFVIIIFSIILFFTMYKLKNKS